MPTSAELGLTSCNQCGECCRTSSCHLGESDLVRIPRALGMSKLDFAARYLVLHKVGERFAAKPRMTEAGCVFLRDNRCTIQGVKPKGGREFECWTPQPPSTHYLLPVAVLRKQLGMRIQ